MWKAEVRSYNKGFPEEINRLICDHLSTLVFVPTQRGVKNLYREGFGATNRAPIPLTMKIYFCGDIMHDNSLHFFFCSGPAFRYSRKLQLENKSFSLVTMHRPSNVDDPAVLAQLFTTFHTLAEEKTPRW